MPTVHARRRRREGNSTEGGEEEKRGAFELSTGLPREEGDPIKDRPRIVPAISRRTTRTNILGIFLETAGVREREGEIKGREKKKGRAKIKTENDTQRCVLASVCTSGDAGGGGRHRRRR